MDTVLAVLPWILPPLLGAIIGYVTNRIAIKMLFRPLNPKRLLGFRIPLTPGVIPRNRYDLARTIGRMVSEQLLSPQALREQLDTPEFRRDLASWIRDRRHALMQTQVGRPHSFDELRTGPTLPPEGEGISNTGGTPSPLRQAQDRHNPFPEGEGTLSGAETRNDAEPQLPGNGFGNGLPEIAEELLAGFLASPQCARMVQSLAEQVTRDVGGKRVSDITSAEQLTDFVHENVLPALRNPELGNTASELVSNWVRDQLNQNRRMREYLTPQNLEAVQGLIRNNLPTATWLVFNWMRQPDMSQKLVQIGQTWVEDTVRSQGILTRAILSLSGKKEEAIRDMPNIIGNLIDEAERSMSAPEMQDLIAEAVGITLERISGRRIKWLIGSNEETIYWMADRATRGAFTALSETSRASVREAANRFYEKNSTATLGEMAERTLGVETAVVSDITASMMLSYLTAPETPGKITGLARSVGGNGSDGGEPVTLGELIPLSEEAGERLDQYLSDQVVGFLSDNLPELSRIIDVETLVINRIDSFETRDVETLVMSISGKHLRWINWFGAGLGAIIGLIQLGINPPL